MIYERLIRPALFRLGGGDAEGAHEAVMRQLARVSNSPTLLGMTARIASINARALRRNLFGLRFPNPVGLAGGFDKNGIAVPALEALGFGFVEVGTVTRFAQAGNPKPRLFRYPGNLALINRMGFNNDGAPALAERLKALRRQRRLEIPLGVSIGKSKVTPLEEAVDDYLASLEELYRYADYFAVNVSSPNTPGLRALQERTELENLLAALREKSHLLAEDQGILPRPLLLKISPDLTFDALDELLEVCVSRHVDGLIAVNTTIERPGFAPNPPQEGGLSGKPLFIKSISVVEHIKKNAPQMPVVGVGGIITADDAVRMLDAGADLLQVYTGFIYGGPLCAKKLARGILDHLTNPDG